MGLFKIGFVLSALSVVLLSVAVLKIDLVYNLISPIPDKQKALPYEDRVWTSEPGKLDESVGPFKIDFPESGLEDLRNRLKQTKFSTELPGVNFEYGLPAGELKKVA